MSKRGSPKVIGAFVLGAIAIAIAAVAFLGSGALFKNTREFVVYIDGSVTGLRVGAPVRFRGVEVGQVVSVLLDIEGTHRRADFFAIPVIFEIDETRIRRRGGSVDVHSEQFHDSMLVLGMHASLETESIVTGVRYIALDFYPDEPVVLMNVPGSPYPELPTISTGMSQLSNKLQETIGKLSEIEIDLLVEKITSTVDGVDRIVNSAEVLETTATLPEIAHNLNRTLASLQEVAAALDTTVGPMRADLERSVDEGTQTMEEMQATLAAARALMRPGSPTVVQLESTLTDLASAARSLRLLADYLERNPSAIVRGKEGQ